MATDRRVPPSTYLIGGILALGMVLPILMFAGGGSRTTGKHESITTGSGPLVGLKIERGEILHLSFTGFGTGYGYQPDPLLRFRKLLQSRCWTLAEPPRNPQGMLEAVHKRTGLVFVLVSAGSFQMGSPENEAGRSTVV